MLRTASFYPEFFRNLSGKVIALSSESDRCIRSAQMNLASFYEPNINWTIDEYLKWQPIPIHYLPKMEDKFLYPLSYCPRATKESLTTYTLLEQYINVTYKELFLNFQKYSDSKIKDVKELFYFYDTMFVKKIHNLTTPSWVEPYWHALEDITEKYFLWFSNSYILQRLRAGPFLERLTKLMLQKKNGELPRQKLHMYSSHDLMLSTVLSALRLYNQRRPPYCATLIFELYEGVQKVNLIRLLYLNSTTPELGHQKIHILKLKGCSEFCPLEYFINYITHVIPENWERECLIPEDSLNLGVSSITWILTVALLCSLLINAFLLCKRFFVRNKSA